MKLIINGYTTIEDFDSEQLLPEISSVEISSSVTSIGGNSWENLETFIISEDNSNYKSIDGVLYSKDGKNLIRCPRGKSGSVTIISGVEYIENLAFHNCGYLTSITIPDSVTSIGFASFYGCTSLSRINFESSTLPSDIGIAAFMRAGESVSETKKVYIANNNETQRNTALATLKAWDADIPTGPSLPGDWTVAEYSSTLTYSESISLTTTNFNVGKKISEVGVTGFDNEKFEIEDIKIASAEYNWLSSDTVLTDQNYNIAVFLKIKDGVDLVYAHDSDDFYTGAVKINGTNVDEKSVGDLYNNGTLNSGSPGSQYPKHLGVVTLSVSPSSAPSGAGGGNNNSNTESSNTSNESSSNESSSNESSSNNASTNNSGKAVITEAVKATETTPAVAISVTKPAETVALTDAEKSAISSGKDVNIFVEVSDANVPAQDVAAMKRVTSNNSMKYGQSLDIDLYSMIAGDASTKRAITSTTTDIPVTVSVPANLQKHGRYFWVVRNHNGKTEILPATYDENTQTITFATRLFSSYAIVYSDVPLSPDTGENAPIYPILAVIIAGALGLLVVNRKKYME